MSSHCATEAANAISVIRLAFRLLFFPRDGVRLSKTRLVLSVGLQGEENSQAECR